MNLLALLPNVRFVHTFYRWNLIYTDPDDNKYCDTAIAGTADYIVTEDKHFDILKKTSYPSIAVLSIDEFSNLLISK